MTDDWLEKAKALLAKGANWRCNETPGCSEWAEMLREALGALEAAEKALADRIERGRIAGEKMKKIMADMVAKSDAIVLHCEAGDAALTALRAWVTGQACEAEETCECYNKSKCKCVPCGVCLPCIEKARKP